MAGQRHLAADVSVYRHLCHAIGRRSQPDGAVK